MIRTLLFSALLSSFFLSTGFGCCDKRDDPRPRCSQRHHCDGNQSNGNGSNAGGTQTKTDN